MVIWTYLKKQNIWKLILHIALGHQSTNKENTIIAVSNWTFLKQHSRQNKSEKLFTLAYETLNVIMDMSFIVWQKYAKTTRAGPHTHMWNPTNGSNPVIVFILHLRNLPSSGRSSGLKSSSGVAFSGSFCAPVDVSTSSAGVPFDAAPAFFFLFLFLFPVHIQMKLQKCSNNKKLCLHPNYQTKTIQKSKFA